MDSLVAKAEGMAQYMNLSTTAVEQLLTRIPDLDDRVYSALAGAAAAGGEEALSASDLTRYLLQRAVSIPIHPLNIPSLFSIHPLNIPSHDTTRHDDMTPA